MEKVNLFKGLTSNDCLYFDLPMYPITNYFHGGASPALKYKDHYICGLWVADYHYEGNSYAMAPKSSLVDYGKHFLGLLEENNSDFGNFLYEHYQQIIALGDKLQELNYREVKDGKLPELNEYFPEYHEEFPLVIGLGYVIDTTLEYYAREKGLEMDSIVVPGESFIKKEEKALYAVSRIENQEEREHALVEHMARYSFLLSNYKGYNPIPRSYFTDRIPGMAAKYENDEHKGEIKQPENENEWIGLSIYIRDERKRCNMLFNAIYLRYIKRECERLGISYEAAVMLTPQEFEATKNGILHDYHGRRIVQTSHEGGFVDITEEDWESFPHKPSDTSLKGFVACKGKVTGRAKIIMNSGDFHKVEAGDIIVASMTRPEFAPVLEKAAAIVTNEGGITCHAAIISREMKKPCIIGTQFATKVLKDGDMIEVDAEKGVITIVKN